ncbi:MAG: hypothetical protein WCU00_13560 [Candidatus Latescibacterota bacterium]
MSLYEKSIVIACMAALFVAAGSLSVSGQSSGLGGKGKVPAGF